MEETPGPIARTRGVALQQVDDPIGKSLLSPSTTFRLPALGLFASGLVQSKGRILVGRNAVFKFFLDTSESALKLGHYPERVHPCNRCGTAEAIRHGCRIVRRVRWLGVQPRGLPIPI
jgi:hypothetical protein